MSKLIREIISRSTFTLVGAALIYGGVACYRAGSSWAAEYEQKNPQNFSKREDMSGAGYAYLMGGFLLLCGGTLVLYAIIPTDLLLRFFPLSNTTLHQNPRADNPRGRW